MNGGRFLAEARFRSAPDAARQSAHSSEITDDTGAFWFFQPDNLELIVKVLDGCAINDSWWVFATGLTDLEVELAITSASTGAERRISNLAGQPFLPTFDISAFPCP